MILPQSHQAPKFGSELESDDADFTDFHGFCFD
jgi:hypothetical protein